MTGLSINEVPSEVILWGGTGQAKVVRPIIEHNDGRVVAIFDDTPDLPPPFPDIDCLLGWDGFLQWIKGRQRGEIGFCVAIGNPHGHARLRLHDRLSRQGLVPVTIAHHTAFIAKNATIGVGSQILAGAVIAPEARIGRQCIVNTRASVDHESVMDDGSEIGPGATLCGLVTLETNAWVCAGATVIPRIRIGANAIVGAGSAVIRDVAPGTTVAGVPAKPITKRVAT